MALFTCKVSSINSPSYNVHVLVTVVNECLFHFQIHGFDNFDTNYEKTNFAILNQLRTAEIT